MFSGLHLDLSVLKKGSQARGQGGTEARRARRPLLGPKQEISFIRNPMRRCYHLNRGRLLYNARLRMKKSVKNFFMFKYV